MTFSTMTDVEEMNLNEFRRDDYKDVISQISEDILLDNILDQINDSLNAEEIDNRYSLFNYFKDRIGKLLKEYTVGDEEYPEVVHSINNVLTIISDKIEEVYSLNIEYGDMIDIETKLEYVEALYTFLTIDIYKHVFNFTDKFIKDNIENYIIEIGKVDKVDRENLSYKFIQNDIDNKYTPVVYRTKEIINTLSFPSDMYAEDVFEKMIEDDQGEVINNTIARIFIDNDWVDVIYEESLLDILLELIHGNENLIKDIKISLIEEYKEVE